MRSEMSDMERTTSTVGARELRTRLGSYLKRVGRGHSFIVTDRHQPVAELRPTAPADHASAVDGVRRVRHGAPGCCGG